METKSPKSAWEQKLVYPTARDFDDLFHQAVPAVDKEHPVGWGHDWVVEVEDPETGMNKLGCITIGPFCHIGNGNSLWIDVRQHLINTVKKIMVDEQRGSIFFEIIHPDDKYFAAVFARYTGSKKRHPIAKIKWSTVPFQKTVSVPS